MRSPTLFAAAFGVVAIACSGSPTAPVTIPLPGGPSTNDAPVIRSISVPTSRIEANVDVSITAVVEDAETPLSALSFTWSASAGTITGNGLSATYRHAPGLTKGVDVVISLTVGEPIKGSGGQTELRTVRHATPFRVHDSAAEMKELARRFLIDLFGNSSIPAEACLVDFSDGKACEGAKDSELEEIKTHRKDYVVHSATMLQQSVEMSATAGLVTSAVRYLDSFHGAPAKNTCTDFYLTTVYERDRWSLCESTISRSEPPAICGNTANDGGVFRVFSGGGVK